MKTINKLLFTSNNSKQTVKQMIYEGIKYLIKLQNPSDVSSINNDIYHKYFSTFFGLNTIKYYNLSGNKFYDIQKLVITIKKCNEPESELANLKKKYSDTELKERLQSISCDKRYIQLFNIENIKQNFIYPFIYDTQVKSKNKTITKTKKIVVFLF